MEIGTRDGSLGRIIFEVFEDRVPRTAKNFIQLCTGENGFGYKGCKLHRIIPGFCIQGGDFERGDGSGGWSIYGNKFEDEGFDIRHSKAGLLSMANSGPDTNGSQFFITLEETPHLDGKHVIFGQVLEGMDTVRKVESYGSQQGQPSDKIKIMRCGKL